MIKKSVIYLVASLLISLIFIGVYQIDNFRVEKVDISTLKTLDKDNDQYIMNIDRVSENEDYIEVDGWAIEKGVTNEYFNWVSGKDKAVYNNNQVVFQDEDGNVYAINTISQDRADVNSEINDNINYAKCGFKGLVKRSKLKENKNYKLGVIIMTLDKEKILIMSEEEIEF